MEIELENDQITPTAMRMKIIVPMVIKIVERIIAPLINKYNFALLSGSSKYSSMGSMFKIIPLYHFFNFLFCKFEYSSYQKDILSSCW